MTEKDLNLFKEILSVPSKTYEETRMVNFLCTYLDNRDYNYFVDHKRNIYVTKGQSEVYPCVLSHTDTVHNIRGNINIREEYGYRPETFKKIYNDQTPRQILKGYRDNGKPTGCGGDDKAGIFICLRLLEVLPVVKVAFFVSEETGCWGSREANVDFFSNVGYSIQFDAPGNNLITEVCAGVRLFERDSDFFRICDPIIQEMIDQPMYQSHPFTDASQLKMKFDHACINISCGYYHMHTDREFVDVLDVENIFRLGQELVQRLGNVKYLFRDRTMEIRLEKQKDFTELLELMRKDLKLRDETSILEFRENLPPRLKSVFDVEFDFYLR